MKDFEEQELELRTLDFSLAPGYYSNPTFAGLPATEETLLQLPAFVCGIRCLSEDVAGMPCYLYDRDENGHLDEDTDNDLYHLLLSEPNAEMTSFVFHKLMVQNALIFGAGIAEIERNNRGEPLALWPVHPHFVRPYRDMETGTLIYQDTRTPSGGPPGFGTKYLDASDVIHLQLNLSLMGSTGMSLLHLARQVISSGLAMERYEGSVWKNASKSKGYIRETAPGVKNSPQAEQNTKESWQKQSEREEVGKTNYLKYPLEYVELALTNPEQLEMYRLKEAHVNSVARMLRLSPIKLMNYQEATWANSKEFNKAHFNESIRPICIPYEQELQKKLLTPITKKRKRIRFDPSDLLRADPLTSGQVGQIAVGQPWKSVNEQRKQEGLPYMGEEFDIIGTKPALPDPAPTVDSPDEESSVDNGNPTPVVVPPMSQEMGVL